MQRQQSAPSLVSVTVPAGLKTGDEFAINYLGFRFKVVVPPGSSAGSNLTIRLSPEAWAHALTEGG